MQDEADDVGEGHDADGPEVVVHNEDPVGLGGAEPTDDLEGGVFGLAGEDRGAGVDVEPADLVEELDDGLLEGLVVEQEELDVGAAGVGDELAVVVDHADAGPAGAVELGEGGEGGVGLEDGEHGGGAQLELGDGLPEVVVLLADGEEVGDDGGLGDDVGHPAVLVDHRDAVGARGEHLAHVQQAGVPGDGLEGVAAAEICIRNKNI